METITKKDPDCENVLAFLLKSYKQDVFNAIHERPENKTEALKELQSTHELITRLVLE